MYAFSLKMLSLQLWRFNQGKTPEKTKTYNNGKIDVAAKPSKVITVTKENVKATIIESGYYKLQNLKVSK